MSAYDIGAYIKLDGEKEFKDAVSNVNKNIRELNSELNLVKTEYQNNANSLEALTKKQELFQKKAEAHKNKINEINEGLENAKKKYQQFGESLAEARDTVDKASKKLEEMKASSDTSTEAIEAQENEVKRLSEELKKSEDNYQKQANRVTDWKTKLNNAQAELTRANKQLDENEKYLKEAQTSTDHCATSIDQYGKKVKEASEETEGFGENVENALVNTLTRKGVDAVQQLGEALLETTADFEKASNQIQAGTGASSAAMSEYNDVLKEVYTNNYGENYEEVADAVSRITQNMGELNESTLTDITESVFALQDTFDMDLNETIRGAQALIENMGVDAQTAFDLIAKGAQNGLNKSDELTDNLAEYTQIWGQAGFSAQEMFAILQNGLDAGAYNLDKVNDFVKEFAISLSDGRIEDGISNFSAGSQNLFYQWKEGGATTAEVFQSIISDLAGMENQQEALTIASDTWSALGEDNAMKVITSLVEVNDEYTNVAGTMDEIKDVKYDDVASQISQLSRQLQAQLAPAAETALSAANAGLKLITENIDTVKIGFTGLASAAALSKISKAEWFLKAASAIKKLTSATEGATVAQTALNLVQNMSPMGVLVAGITAVTAGMMLLSTAAKAANSEIAEYLDDTEEITGRMEELNESAKESSAAFSESQASVEAEYGSLQILSDRLYELAGSEEESNAKKLEMQAIVESLNEAIPGLNLAIDEQTGALNKNAEAMQGYLDSAEESAILEVAGDRIKELAKQQAEAQLTAAEAELEIAEIQAQIDALMESVVTEDDPSGIDRTMYRVQELEGKQDELKATIRESEEAATSYETEMENVRNAYGMVTDAAQEGSEAAEESGNSYEEAGEKIAASSETTKEALDSLHEKYNEVRESIKDSLEDKISLFDMFDGGEEISADDMLANLDSQLEGLKNYQENMATLAGQLGDAIGVDLYNALSDMGPSAANAVQELVDALDSGDVEKVRQISDKYAEALDFTDEAADSMSGVAAIVKNAVGEMGSSEADFTELSNAFEKAIDGKAISDSLRESFEDAVQTAKSCGAEIPEGLADGLKNGEITVTEAISQLNGSVEAQFQFLQELANEAGITIPEEIQEGISQGGDAAIAAIEDLNSLFIEKQAEVQAPAEEGGSATSDSIGSGIAGNASAVTGATESVMNSTRAAVTSQYSSFQSAGAYIASGIQTGIHSKIQEIAEAAANVVRKALQAAKDAGIIESPSKIFRDQVGKQIGAGIEVGITSQINTVAAAAKKLVKNTSDTAKKLLNSFYKELAEESNEAAQKTKEKQEEKNNTILQAAETALDQYKTLNRLSLEDEKKYWQNVIKTLKKGTQAWYDAKQKIKEVKEEMADFAASGSALSMYETYVDVSAKAEMQYWQIVREQLEEGTEARIEADQNYKEAKESYYDQLTELEEDYVAEVEELTQEYVDAYEDRKDAIKSSFGLFDEFTSESESGETLLANMQSQVAGYALWMEQLEELGSKGILDSDFMEELQEMRPEAAATIVALNQLTEEQLEQAQEAYEQKNALAEAQAAKETESLRQETEEKIKEVTATYQEELASLTEPIDSALKSIAKNAANLGSESVASLLESMTKEASSATSNEKYKEVKKTIKSGLSSLPSAGKTIGTNTLAGILEGLSDKLTIKKGAQSFSDELEAAIKKSFGIASPSKLFRDQIGYQLSAGVAVGINEGAQEAVDAGADMAIQALTAAQEKLQSQQQEIVDYTESIYSNAGIEELNKQISVPVFQNMSVTVESRDVVQALSQMSEMMEIMYQTLKKTKVVLDTGELVGGIYEEMSYKLASEVRSSI